LLNLAAALGNAPGINTTTPGTFAVKRRWDDGALLCVVNFQMNERTAFVLPFLADLIFKNQAASDKDNPRGGQFVNDLLRTEFHK
jgi:protein CWC15